MDLVRHDFLKKSNTSYKGFFKNANYEEINLLISHYLLLCMILYL